MNFSKFKALTRLEQTFFGLPFLLAAIFLPFLERQTEPKALLRLLWIVPAFMAARISGMAFNQFIDRKIDARNPRTVGRPIPNGDVTAKQAAITAWVALGIFLLICVQQGPLLGFLSFFAALLIAVYSYLKRVTSLCHFVIGIIHVLCPLMAWVAMTGSVALAPLLLGGVAFFSITGNEVVYAIADMAFDRYVGLHSVPAKWGIQRSLWLARGLHFCCALCSLLLGLYCHFCPIYYLGTLGIFLLFLYFHFQWKRKEMLFFANVGVSVLMLIFTSVALLWRVLL